VVDALVDEDLLDGILVSVQSIPPVQLPPQNPERLEQMAEVSRVVSMGTDKAQRIQSSLPSSPGSVIENIGGSL